MAQAIALCTQSVLWTVSHPLNRLTSVYMNMAINIMCLGVVGRNGDTIRSITRRSKAKIVVETPERRSETRPVVISLSGTAEAIDAAKVLPSSFIFPE